MVTSSFAVHFVVSWVKLTKSANKILKKTFYDQQYVIICNRLKQ